MAQFEYQAKMRDGTLTSGRIRAASQRRAAGMLRRDDLFVVRLAQERRSAQPGTRPHATPQQVAWHMWQLAMMLDTGLAISDAMGCLSRQARQEPLRALLEDIERRVREGQSMSAALEAHGPVFPPSLRALVKASELSGSFKEALRKASQYLLNDVKMVRKLRGAMAYPAAMLIICGCVTVFLLTVILPQFAGVFASRNAALPWPTQVLMDLSEAVLSHWMWLVIGVAGLGTLAVKWSRSAPGKRAIDRFVISAPVVSTLFNTLYQSRMYSTMALMLEAHVPLLDTFRIAQSVAPNSFYQKLWRDVEEQVRVGERLALPLYEAEFIPESVAQVIDNGERNGKLGPVFAHLAEFFEEEHKRVMTATMQLLEPCLIVLMGGIVGFIAVSLMLPLIQASRVMTH